MLTTEVRIILVFCALAAAFLVWWYAGVPLRKGWLDLSRKQRRNVFIGISVAIFVTYVWPTPYRYFSDHGWASRMNRVTGTVQRLIQGEWRRQ